MISDGGGRFVPAGIIGFHTLSLLLASLVAHDPATEDNHTHHTGKNTTEHEYYILIAGTVHKPRQGSINSVPL